MSKKQREKVEDEVRYHRERLVRPQGPAPGGASLASTPTPSTALQLTPQTADPSPDSSVYDQQITQSQQPSSSNQPLPYINGG